VGAQQRYLLPHHQEKDKNKSNTATKESEEELNKRTIFIGNLLPTTTRKTLTKLFKPYGKIQTTRLRSQATTTITHGKTQITAKTKIKSKKRRKLNKKSKLKTQEIHKK